MPYTEYVAPKIVDNSKGWRNSPLYKFITEQYAKENDYSYYNKLIEEIKSELGSALVEQISAEEDVTEEQETDTTFSLDINLTDDSITNSAWDLVKRHKASK